MTRSGSAEFRSLEDATAELESLRKQRNDARRQRDNARKQRDRIKSQLDTLSDTVAASQAAAPPQADPREAVVDTIKLLQDNLDQLSSSLGINMARQRAAHEMTPAQIQSRLFSYANFFRLEQLRSARMPSMQAKLAAGERLSTTEQEILVQRHTPLMHKTLVQRRTPPEDVAFLTVASANFLPGLEGLLLSMLDVYPDFRSDVFVYHDGSLSAFAQRRLAGIYPKVRFIVPDMGWLELIANSSENQKRIGKLGYMNLQAFTHEGYERVIALDSDILILDDISALWAPGDDFYVCHDCGDREYVAMSAYIGDYIVNSGVISIPRKHLNAETFEEIKQVAARSTAPLNDLIDRFADQKTWNLFLKDKSKTFLDINYNCNVKYVVRHLGGNVEGLSIIHFAGAKPWNTSAHLHDDLVSEYNPKSLAYPKIWSDQYRRLLFRNRLEAFGRDTAGDRRSPVLRQPAGVPATCVMIGNGPSIAETPLERFEGLETFCFNWFILHERFEEVRPTHLVLASHMFFGGWNTQTPAFPAGYLDRLLALKHRPVIWTSYYFKPLMDESGLSETFEINYLLFEKPFKRFIDGLGATKCDIRGFLDDGRTGVLSFGAPIAAALGFQRIVLVGCDSNYNTAAAATNYFYDEALHTSLSTKADSLTATWQEGGAGHFAYDVVTEALARKGIQMLDATIGGGLRIPKITIDEIALAPSPVREPDDAFAYGRAS